MLHTLDLNTDNDHRQLNRNPVCALLLMMPVILVINACSVTRDSPHLLQGSNNSTTECRGLYQTFAETLEKHDVRDIQTTPVKNFPWLHVNRFLAGYEINPDNNTAFTAWIDKMQSLAQQTRRIEFNNLPTSAKLTLKNTAHKITGNDKAFLDNLSHCADLLRKHELTLANIRYIQDNTRVESDYQSWKRALGLYPFSALPFAWGIHNWHIDSRAELNRPPDTIPWKGIRELYSLAPGGKTLSVEETRQLISAAQQHPLGIPEFSKEQYQALFAAHAPAFEIDAVTIADNFGQPYWKDRTTPGINTDTQSVYTLLSWNYFHGKILPQLNYVIWFPARPCTSFVDILCGELDGIIWRVTLGTDGTPLHYDTVHNCGCYHTFFPTKGLVKNPEPETLEEWAFTPVLAPEPEFNERILVRLQSRTHHIQSLATIPAAPSASTRPYHFASYNELRSLPMPVNNGNKDSAQRKNLFRSDGIIAGTERKERFLFWPMGVDSPGAMRQWGHHATAFIGQRHFDEPCLLQKYYQPLSQTDNQSSATTAFLCSPASQ